MRLHVFDSTTEAYNATQTDEHVKNGDVLFIPSEQVIGLAWTWPVAVTVNFGSLHSVYTAGDIDALVRDMKISIDQVDDALDLAEHLGWPVNTKWRELKEAHPAPEPIEDVIARFLGYSFRDVKNDYYLLTEAEKQFCTPEQFEKVINWMLTHPNK